MSDMKIILKLIADTGNVKSALEEINKKLGDVGGAGEESGKKLKGSAEESKAAFEGLTEIISGVAAAFTVDAWAEGTRKLIDYNQELNNTVAYLGVSRDAMQVWGLAGKKYGVEVSDVFKDMQEKIGEFASTGGGEAGDVFKRLKLDVNDLIALSPDQQLLKISEAMSKIKDMSRGEKSYLLESLGNDATKLLPLLDNNAQALKELSARAHSTGLIIDDKQNVILTDASNNLQQIDMTLKGMGQSAEMVGARLLNAFSGPITSALTSVSGALSSNADIITNAFGVGVVIAASKAAGALSSYAASAIASVSANMALSAAEGESIALAIEIANVKAAVAAAALAEAEAAVAAATGIARLSITERTLIPAQQALAAATAEATAAMAAQATASGNFAIAGRGLLAALGGIPGLLVAVGAGLYYLKSAHDEARHSIELADGEEYSFSESLQRVNKISEEYRAASKERQNAIRDEIAQTIELTNQRKIEAQAQLDYLAKIKADSAAHADNPFRQAGNAIWQWGAELVNGNAKDNNAIVADTSAAIKHDMAVYADLGKPIDDTADAAKKFYVNQDAVNKTLTGTAPAAAKAAQAIHSHGDALKSAIETLQKQRIYPRQLTLRFQYF
jgi:hypothetical protein